MILQVTENECKSKWNDLQKYYNNIVQSQRPKKKIFFRIEEALKLENQKNSNEQLESTTVNPSSSKQSPIKQPIVSIDVRRSFHEKFLKKEMEIEEILIKENFNTPVKTEDTFETEYLMVDESESHVDDEENDTVDNEMKSQSNSFEKKSNNISQNMVFLHFLKI